MYHIFARTGKEAREPERNKTIILWAQEARMRSLAEHRQCIYLKAMNATK